MQLQLPISLGCDIDSCGGLEEKQIDEEDRTWNLPWRTRHFVFPTRGSALVSSASYNADTRRVWRVRMQHPMCGGTFRFGEINLMDSLPGFVSQLGEPVRAFQIAQSVRAHFWFSDDVVYSAESLTEVEPASGDVPGTVRYFEAWSSSIAPLGHDVESDPLHHPCFLRATKTIEDVARLLAERLVLPKIEMSMVFNQPRASLKAADGTERLTIQGFRDSAIVEINVERPPDRGELAAAVRANVTDLGTVL